MSRASYSSGRVLRIRSGLVQRKRIRCIAQVFPNGIIYEKNILFARNARYNNIMHGYNVYSTVA